MAEWTFFDYKEASGRVPFNDWYLCQAVAVRAHIDDKLLYLASRREWNEKLFKKLQGEDGLYELRIHFKKVEYRPIVCKHPSVAKSFVLLAGATEQNDRLVPSGVLGTAARAKRELEEDHSRAIAHT